VIVTNINEHIHQGADERFPHGVDAREIAAFEALLGILRMTLSRNIK
jgi:hypothetical protein